MTFGGRLTLASAQPVMSADVTSSTLWYAPHNGNTANGITFTFSSTDAVGPPVSLTGLAGNSIHKVFLSSTGGIYLGTPAAGSLYGHGYYGAGNYPGHDPNPPLFRLNGIQVNAAGDAYLGTIQIDPDGGTCTAHFSQGGKRRWGVWNRYNQRSLFLKAGVNPSPQAYYIPTPVMPAWGPVHGNADNCLTVILGEPQQFEANLMIARGVMAGTGAEAASGQYLCGVGINRTDAVEGSPSQYTFEVGALPTAIFNSFSTQAPMVSVLSGSVTAYALESHRYDSCRAWSGNYDMTLTAKWMG